jgi:alpha-tubulin suppressor-like RCC1 family protein
MNLINVVGQNPFDDEAKTTPKTISLGSIAPQQVVTNDSGDLFVLDASNHVYYVGMNSYGCAGVGHSDPLRTLTRIPFYDDKHIVKIFFNYGSVFMITEKGEAYFCGQNTYGTYGVNSDTMTIPKLVDKRRLKIDPNRKFTHVAVCFSSAVAFTDGRHAHCFGQVYWFFNEQGGSIYQQIQDFLEPDEHVVSVSGGFFQAVVVTNKNACYIGGHYQKRYGIQDASLRYEGFRKMDMFNRVKIANCYQYMTTIVTCDDEVYMSNNTESREDAIVPTLNKVGLHIPNVVAATSGDIFQYILTRNGLLYYRTNEVKYPNSQKEEYDFYSVQLQTFAGYETHASMGSSVVVFYLSDNGLMKHFQRLKSHLSESKLVDIELICIR